MKNLILIVFTLIFVTSCKNNQKGTQGNEHLHVEEPTEKVEAVKKPLSPHTSAMEMIGDAHIHIDYSSPGVRNRIVFGGLLPYDEVWQAGAHMATWFASNKDLTISGEKLPAGKYGIFAIPSQTEWIIIFNENWDQHGKDEYDEKDDVIRFNVIPVISENIREHLEYKIAKVSEREGLVSLSWEKVTVSFSFNVE